jgi:[ribosomal protein S18]-alanine N-acetyltransferase
MDLTILPASDGALRELVSWRYGSPYEFYDGDGVIPLNPERFYEARDEHGSFVGFYYFEERGSALFYGLGLRPDLTGRGLGLDFLRAGLAFGRRLYDPEKIILDVAAFNERARIVYERAGFRVVGRHTRSFERWGEVEFLDMELTGDES